MSYLLDTCVVSEWTRSRPSAAVAKWLDSREGVPIFLSVVTIGEIAQGIARMRDTRRAEALSAWLRDDIIPRFEGMILDIGMDIALRCGDLRGRAMAGGKIPPVIDSLLAATALFHGLTLVTRNVEDFEPLSVRVVNPWQIP